MELRPTTPGIRRAARATAALAAAGLILTACTPGTDGPTPVPAQPTEAQPPTAEYIPQVQPSGEVSRLVPDLDAPWSIVPITEQLAAVSERDTGRVLIVQTDGTTQHVGTVPGVVAEGEGGLLGLAVLLEATDAFEDEPAEEDASATDDLTDWLYAYFTAEDDNRIVRMPIGDEFGLGEPELVLDGIAKSSTHNGGRIAFGPDGMLYASTGDASAPSTSQDLSSLNGKILRMTPEGAAPDDNPYEDSLIYASGLRNSQGLAWDSSGTLWATEFGANTWDELNRIVPGGNYGWPEVEGSGGGDDFIDPVVEWRPEEASPSGLAYLDGSFFIASLRGERIWAVYPDEAPGTDGVIDSVEIVPWYEGDFGRIRDVAISPSGTLWFLSNNTDGRGTPSSDDDGLFEVELEAR